ncbi:helix-hairpin-helix domain-containing protein [Egicoccus sp. AB-alg6-2]|uniref:helix-hairpin-helix domain-containing protein n=1 Tax=Egicoccus sp. AB-alg6-2 TaxID=3242692 RepID=UPI00359D57F4
MILLSLVLVVAAAVLLVLGWFQDGLTLIYLSIAACLLSMLLLGASVLLRRRGDATGTPAPLVGGTAPASAATTGPVTDNDADAPEAVRPDRRAAVVRRSAPATSPVADTPDPLAGVRGLGPSRRAALLERFGTVEAIRAASVEELSEVAGMTPALAQSVQEQLR